MDKFAESKSIDGIDPEHFYALEKYFKIRAAGHDEEESKTIFKMITGEDYTHFPSRTFHPQGAWYWSNLETGYAPDCKSYGYKARLRTAVRIHKEKLERLEWTKRTNGKQH
jgi:hypothetical protein